MSFQKPLEILIFGTGALGATLAWRLSRNNHIRVSVVCRSNYDVVCRKGFNLVTRMWGNGVFIPYRVVRSVQELNNIPFDYVVTAHKILPANTPSIMENLKAIVSPSTTLVAVQNGVQAETPLRSAFPNNTILSGVSYINCIQPWLGEVHQTLQVRPHAVHVGIFGPHCDHTRRDRQKLEQFVALDNKFKAIHDSRVERWTKQAFNGAVNPMTAITGLDTSALVSSPYVDVARQLAVETCDVALAHDVPLTKERVVEQVIESARTSVGLIPSMLQDARAGRQMEVELICGDICRLADTRNVPVPITRMIYQVLVAMNRQAMETVAGSVREIRPLSPLKHEARYESPLMSAAPWTFQEVTARHRRLSI